MAYNSFMATFTLARAFRIALLRIGFIFDRESLCSNLSLSVLEHRIKNVENDEQIVKALEKDVGDEKHQKALERVERCKKLLNLVREWPLMKEDVNYFIDSMDNIVAILNLLCEDDDQWMVFRVNELFCKTDIGWHKPSRFLQVNQLQHNIEP